MPLFPVAAREARLAARSKSLYGWRLMIAGVGLLLIPAVLWSEPGRALKGPPVFMVLSSMAFIYAVFGGVLRTADSLSEEKRENTLGLLFLTDLKATDIISGKLFASTATIFFGLLAILPLLAIPILLGGVSWKQLIEVYLNLINTLFLSISWGLLISTISRQAWAAILLSVLVMLFINLGIVQLASSLLTVGGLEFLFLFSPLIGHVMSVRPDAPVGGIHFWQCLAVNHFLAWLNIALTAYLLPAAWKEIPRSKRAEAWWRRAQWLRFGSAKTRAHFRKRLLNTNPLFWLSGREQVSSGGLMLALLLIAFFSFVSEWTGIVIGLLLMHGLILVRMASAASHSLAEDRKSGALELLLATSLSVREVLRGRWMALGRQFTGPILIVLIWHFFALAWVSMVDAGQMGNILLLWGFPVALLLWFATGWCGLWFGLRARNPTAAVWSTVTAALLAPWLLLTTLFGLAPFLGIMPSQAWTMRGWTSYSPPVGVFGTAAPLLASTQLISSGFFLWSLYLWGLAVWSARKIRARFREAATDRFSDTQPFDWTPIRRAFVRFGAVAILMLALALGWRMLTNYRGERALREAFTAYPNFKMEAPDLPMYPADQNLARWDFMANLNDPMGRITFRKGQKVSLHQLIMYGFAGDDVLNNWHGGRMMSIKGKSQTPAQLAAAYLKRYEAFEPEVARLIEAARERPYIQLPPSPSLASQRMAAMFAGGATPGDALQGLVQYLGRDACARLTVGERPIEEALLTVRLAVSLTNHPGELDKLNQMISIAIQPIYDGIQWHRWSDSDLQAIQKAFAQIDFFQCYDRWREQATRDYLSGKPLGSTASFFTGGTGPGVVTMQVESDNTGAMKMMQADLIHYTMGRLHKGANSETRQIDFGATVLPSSQEASLGAVQQTASQMISAVARGQTAVDQVLIASALERYRIAHAKYPPALSELIPGYLAKIPNDVVMGQPPVYRVEVEKEGFILYSLGFDRKDGGGKPNQYQTDDWVWLVEKRAP